jgi:hypothetical protein
MSLGLPKKNDQVFQLSLTELAFTLVFLLLLLCGWIVISQKSDFEKKEAANAILIVEAKKTKAEAEKTLADLQVVLSGRVANPEETLSELRKCSRREVENEGLRAQIVSQGAKLTALAAVDETLKSKAGSEELQKEIENALAFKKAYQEKTGKALQRNEVETLAAQCAEAEKKLSNIAKDNQNLRGQVAFMGKQVAAIKGTKGFGLPPCWVDAEGKVQRLLSVEVTEQGLIVKPGWPPERSDDANSLPNLNAALANGSVQSISSFRTGVAPVLDWSKKQDPECRHYASIGVSATSANVAVAGDNAVNDYFYPYGKVAVVRR